MPPRCHCMRWGALRGHVLKPAHRPARRRAPAGLRLPEELPHLAPSLRRLELPRCGLWVLPDQVAQLTGLTRLDLGRNGVLHLPTLGCAQRAGDGRAVEAGLCLVTWWHPALPIYQPPPLLPLQAASPTGGAGALWLARHQRRHRAAGLPRAALAGPGHAALRAAPPRHAGRQRPAGGRRVRRRRGVPLAGFLSSHSAGGAAVGLRSVRWLRCPVCVRPCGCAQPSHFNSGGGCRPPPELGLAAAHSRHTPNSTATGAAGPRRNSLSVALLLAVGPGHVAGPLRYSLVLVAPLHTPLHAHMVVCSILLLYVNTRKLQWSVRRGLCAFTWCGRRAGGRRAGACGARQPHTAAHTHCRSCHAHDRGTFRPQTTPLTGFVCPLLRPASPSRPSQRSSNPRSEREASSGAAAPALAATCCPPPPRP